MHKVSTTTQFIMLVFFALTLNLWSLSSMLLLLVTLFLMLSYQKNNHFFRLIKRLKWFYLVMFFIFLFNTPGEHILNWPHSVKPTYEGLTQGVKQVLRITLMLAALSLILAQNSMQQLISGLYFLLRPLSLIGVDVKRFAARLWLTLHYVEVQQANNSHKVSLVKGLGERLNDAFTNDEQQYIEVTLEKTKLTWLDYAIIPMMFAILISAYLLRGP